jgi:molybdopterin synthase sulfur carrier subunit
LRAVNVTVRYFAGAREAVGREEEILVLDEGSRVSTLIEVLLRLHPALEALTASLRYALDERFVAPQTPLAEGAVVALIPPVGGG